MSHTPTPWTHQGLEDEGEERGAVFLIGEDLGGMVGAALPWATELNDGDFARVVANADFIVKAVNSHDDLVKQLQRSTVQMRIWVSNNGDMIGALGEQIAANEAALTKAGVK